MDLPILDKCNSWVATSPSGTVVELFGRENAGKALASGWKLEASLDYLCRINAEIKSRAP